MKFKVIAIALASIASFSAYADQGKTYWGGEFGISKLDDQTGSITSGLVSAVGGAATATQDSNISTFKILGGYRYTENLDLEVAYFQSGTANLNFNGVSRGAVAYMCCWSSTRPLPSSNVSCALQPVRTSLATTKSCLPVNWGK